MKKENLDYRILVLHRGWVVVGEYSENGDEIILKHSRVIRTWGTAQGLGELEHGPLKNTVLDLGGTIRVQKLAVVLSIDVDANGWISGIVEKRLTR